MERCAVFCCRGLGDGLISLVLSHNLVSVGYEVVTYHPFLKAMQPLFPHLRLEPFPKKEECASFDRIFIFYEKSPEMKEILDFCEKNFPEKTKVLNPIATLKRDYPYWEVGKFDGSVPFAENLRVFCKDQLGIVEATPLNGITLPKGAAKGLHAQRIVIHPVSSKLDKNWTPEKFIYLAKRLETSGFEPYFVLTEKEKELFPEKNIRLAPPSDLVSLAIWIYESRAMIGNDSGIGHLASCLGLPTVTICRNKIASFFWRPAWALAAVVTPPSWIPNIKRCRLRDWYWQQWIPVSSVFSRFCQLCKPGNQRPKGFSLGKKHIVGETE